MAYKTIATAERGWFFVQTDQAQIQAAKQPGPWIWRVAAWALDEEDRVIGLISAATHPNTGQASGKQAVLVEPSADTNGEYKHYNELTQAELAMLNSHPNCPNRGLL